MVDPAFKSESDPAMVLATRQESVTREVAQALSVVDEHVEQLTDAELVEALLQAVPRGRQLAKRRAAADAADRGNAD